MLYYNVGFRTYTYLGEETVTRRHKFALEKRLHENNSTAKNARDLCQAMNFTGCSCKLLTNIKLDTCLLKSGLLQLVIWRLVETTCSNPVDIKFPAKSLLISCNGLVINKLIRGCVYMTCDSLFLTAYVLTVCAYICACFWLCDGK